MTKEDFISVLRGHPRTNDAIYWFCQAWHSGDDDLYKIMCSLDFTPRPWSDNPMIEDRARPGRFIANPNYDPDLVGLLTRLNDAFHPVVQPEFECVRLDAVKEGQVLTAGDQFACIRNKWPCRVYRHHGALGVECSGGVHGVKLLPGSERTFHRLTEDENGYVVGFLR